MQYMFYRLQSRTGRLIFKICVFSIGMILISSIVTFGNEADKECGEGTQVPRKTIEELLKAHTNNLMSIPGVVGTAQGLCSGQPCIKVFVDRKTPRLEQRIPSSDPRDRKVQVAWRYPAMIYDY
jgi:hypothetical protein